VSLKVLLLSNCGLGPSGCISIAETLSGCPNLEIIDISRNRIENEGA